MKIATIFGTRPEIIKLSPLIPLFDREFNQILIHTGQHYSYSMDKIFFEDLELRDCDYTLNIGSGTHAQQTAKMLMKIEEVLIDEKPDIVMVQGDTNSTLAGALASSKLNITVAHIEAGCRSFDRSMPEEINRIVVDNLSDFLFAPDMNAYNNLVDEGISPDKVYIVGNTSIDASLRAMNIFKNKNSSNFPLKNGNYILLTIHRQENTEYKQLKDILNAVNIISNKIEVLFPVHLRTRNVINDYNIEISENITLTDPLGYKDFMGLLANSKFVMTDSGGIQEESAVLNVPCLILRDSTEWISYVNMGKNLLVGTDPHKIVDVVNELLDNDKLLIKMRNIKVSTKKDSAESILSILKDILKC